MTQGKTYWPVRIKDGVIVCVEPAVQQLGSYVLLEQEDWYDDELGFLRQYVGDRMNGIDIGAGQGVYALSIAKKMSAGHIWAFEQNPAHAGMLAASVELNGFNDRITLVQTGLSGHPGRQETAATETLDEFTRTNHIDASFGFVRLGTDVNGVDILRGGRSFFMQQSPLVLFGLMHEGKVNDDLIDAFALLGYEIYRLLPDLNILVEYAPASRGDALNLFACKPALAASLSGQGLLAGGTDKAAISPASLNNGPGWQQIRDFPYAQACEDEWLAHIDEVPAEYLDALSACLKAHDRSLPAATRATLLQEASNIVDGMLQRDPRAHYAIWLLKIHLLNVQNHRALSVNYCRQLISAFPRHVAPSWPFIPPSRAFFERKVEGPVGSWVTCVLHEFIEYRQNLSSFYSPTPLPGLKQLLDQKGHDLAIERRFVLAAKKSGSVSLQIPAGFPLLDPEKTPNSAIWHQILGTGFSCSLLDGQSPVHIVDIGASTHGKMTEPYASLMQMGLAKVTGFEPNKVECQRLNEMYASSKVYHYYPEFVGKGGPATFYETNWYMTGSLYKPNKSLLESFEQLSDVTTLQAEHPVNTIGLAQLEDLDEIDLIKIDVQGAELDVFQGAAEKLDDALVIWTEVEFVPLYENQPLFAEVDQYMRQKGFIFHTFEGIATRGYKPYCGMTANRAGLRQAIWTDAIFIRDTNRWDQLSTLKLKKLAAILDAVTKSYDLCYLALQLIDKREATELSSQYQTLRNLA